MVHGKHLKDEHQDRGRHRSRLVRDFRESSVTSYRRYWRKHKNENQDYDDYGESEPEHEAYRRKQVVNGVKKRKTRKCSCKRK